MYVGVFLRMLYIHDQVILPNYPGQDILLILNRVGRKRGPASFPNLKYSTQTFNIQFNVSCGHFVDGLFFEMVEKGVFYS